MFIRAPPKSHPHIRLDVQFQPLGNSGNGCKNSTVPTLQMRKVKRREEKSLVPRLKGWTEELGLKPTHAGLPSLCCLPWSCTPRDLLVPFLPPSSDLPVPLQRPSPGTGTALEPEASMATRTEASRGPELLTTRHTYSPESAGDTWCSRSREPWV